MCGVVIGRGGGLRELQFLEGFYFFYKLVWKYCGIRFEYGIWWVLSDFYDEILVSGTGLLSRNVGFLTWGAAPAKSAFALLLVLVLAKLEIIPNAAPCPALDLPLLLVSLFVYS